MEHTTYLFIDGRYAQDIYCKAMQRVFEEPGELSVHAMVSSIGRQPFRTYYYDCVDDLKKSSETESDFQARLAKQEEFFTRTSSLYGVHFQRGTLKGQRRREQKEVDVLLAVDMLTHGFNRSMTRAILIAGDLDFRPVVEALVRHGIFVEIWYEKTSAAKELPLAADFGRALNWHVLLSWSSPEFSGLHTCPWTLTGHGPLLTTWVIRSGLIAGRKIVLAQESPVHSPILRYEGPSGVEWWTHKDEAVLVRYFEMLYGRIDW